VPGTVSHLILDRDGVLNAEAEGGFVTRAEDWRWLPGVREALARLSAAGIRLSIATNQSGLGRGLMSAEDLARVHARMLGEATRAGATIAGVYVCPHAPADDCECRKPKPKLLLDALAASGVARAATVMVGDDRRDMEAAAAAGLAAVLLRSGKGAIHAEEMRGRGIPVYDDLPSYAQALLDRPGQSP
jgi:D-glycero-D-manno-heptose 1,7-bisphosphate phosphatase